MGMNKPKVVISGSIALDRIMTFSGNFADLIEPSKLHVLSVSVLVDSSETAAGGNAANIAHNLAALGETPVVLGSVGEDAESYVKSLAERGIDTSGVHYSDKKTASFNVLNDSKGNQVGGFYPGAMADAAGLSFEPWAKDGAICWVAPHDPDAMRRQVTEAKRLGLKLAYDPGQQVSNLSGEDLRAGAEAAELLLLNEYELEVFTAKTGLDADMLRQKVPILVTTQGEKGSVIAGVKIGEPVVIGVAKPDKVVDPSGAGDAYRGGFLYGYLRQWSVAKSGQLGATVASFALEQHGPQAKLSKQAIAERYQKTFNEEIEL